MSATLGTCIASCLRSPPPICSYFFSCPTDPDVEFFDDYPGMAETQFQLKIKKSYTPGLFVQFLCEIEACTMTANLEPSPLRKVCQFQFTLLLLGWQFSLLVQTPVTGCHHQNVNQIARLHWHSVIQWWHAKSKCRYFYSAKVSQDIAQHPPPPHS